MVGERDMIQHAKRRFSQGAELDASGVHFRVWGPLWNKAELLRDGAATGAAMAREEDGFWSVFIPGMAAGARYKYRIDDDKQGFPDPASRFQPDGPHGWSVVIDALSFPWTDRGWTGLQLQGQCVYEMHIGTFCEAGTWNGAAEKLTAIKDLGVSILEIMPLAEFPGKFGWGYDGVDFYAPSHLYGTPDDFRRFVDKAHALEIAVILDVVYNHFGPDGNYLDRFSPHYASKDKTDWGEGINFDGDFNKAVRRFVTDNAAYWIEEFHLDGLRLDATQSIVDKSANHILADLTEAARAAGRGRTIVVVGENEPQHAKLLRSAAQGGHGLDGLWNDDFHHAARVALTGRREAYFTDYRGSAQEFVSSAKYGFLFQGQRYIWQEAPRGQSTKGIAPYAFVCFLENHDQTANTVRGQHVCHLTTPGKHRAFTALLLLGPWTPMLFQGQEWSSSNPFFYFADHNTDLAPLVQKGRLEFLRQFPSCRDSDVAAIIPNPSDLHTFNRSRLDWQERDKPEHAAALALHCDLLKLRRSDPTLRREQRAGVTFDGAVLGDECMLLRYFGDRDDCDRLLIVNWGSDKDLSPAPEPLLAPPSGHQWAAVWSSEDVAYGGGGRTDACPPNVPWRLVGHCAILLQAEKCT